MTILEWLALAFALVVIAGGFLWLVTRRDGRPPQE
jgi:hypothetical protein